MGPRRRPGVVALLAGGTGTRVGSPLPKQLIEVGGRPLLEHSLRTFHDHPRVDRIVVVMTPSHLAEARTLVAEGGYDKVSDVVPGGTSRGDSTVAALSVLGEEDCDLLVHDAARPLVTPAVVDACFDALTHHEAIQAAVESPDTIVEVGAGDLVVDIPPRASLRRVQTPQAFRSSVLRRAYELAAADPGAPATDDCGVVRRHLPEVPIAVVPGDERNLKVTTAVDLLVVAALLGDPPQG